MPFDGTDLGLFGNHPLARLGAVESLLASEQHWCKGKLRDSAGRHCLLGAMQVAGARQVLEPIILRAVREVSGKYYWRIERFNDDPRTTHADILRTLRPALENVIAEMIGGDRRRPRREGFAQALRALCSGSVARACIVLRYEQHEPGPRTAGPPSLPDRQAVSSRGSIESTVAAREVRQGR